ncbi:MAG TPA: hypothetical protein VH333_10490, partial [Pseudonocardiaceae bacterium]|nr:hypothetical protein [Pseudonocardiaceae bacterium]
FTKRYSGSRVGVGGWVLVAFVAIGVGLMSIAITTGAVGSPVGRLFGRMPSDIAFGPVSTALIGGLLLITAFIDRLYVHALVRDKFGPGWHRLPGYPVRWPPPKSAWYARRLELIARAMHAANTYVHDGRRMFVGAGKLTHSWTMAVQLKPVENRPSNGTSAESLTASAIYRAVVSEVLSLRTSEGLVPGQRMAGLTHGAVALTSAEALIAHASESIGAAILPDRARPPHSYIDPALITGMVDRPLEWIRPYLCFRVNAWQDELVVSTYLHVGCDANTLYLEWNSYQLDPIRPEYRHELMRLRRGMPVVLEAISATATVPLSVIRRLKLLVRAVTDASGIRSTDDQLDIGPAFGARRSIREIAADTDARTYFQDADGLRYLKLIERATLAAVDYALRSHGLSADEFAQQSMTVITSTVLRPAGCGPHASAVGRPPAHR